MKISIVTPSYNQAGFLEETIKSVVDQGYEHLEYIVIDGGSTDGSAQIIDKYRRHLHYSVSEPDSGHANALNKGFARSSGQIMAWLNSDDKYLPWTLKTVAEIFDEYPQVNWIVGTDAIWNDKGAMVAAYDVHTSVLDYLAGDHHKRMIQAESVFWRRSLWDAAGGFINEGYQLMVDTELWTRFFRFDALWHVYCILAGYRIHGSNRSLADKPKTDAEMRRAIEDMRPHIDVASLGAVRSNYPFLKYDLEKSCWTAGVMRRP
jgi:glycosyltransferase involved in cell wall biosynthesis